MYYEEVCNLPKAIARTFVIMDYGQRNTINEKCYSCKWISFWGNGYCCSNKYSCFDNIKFKKK